MPTPGCLKNWNNDSRVAERYVPGMTDLKTALDNRKKALLTWWDYRAVKLQEEVIASDQVDKAGLSGPEVPVTAFDVRKAILHTRHDIVLLWSSLSSVNAQLQTIKRLLIAVVVLLAYLAIRA